jgi:hypothetical protein
MSDAEFYVIVQERGRSEYSWTLVRKQDSGCPAECVAASPSFFPDYDGALDAGFDALLQLDSKTRAEVIGDGSVRSGVVAAGPATPLQFDRSMEMRVKR